MTVARKSDMQVIPITRTATADNPVVISFYSGDKYYYEAAERLKGDCFNLGLDSDIVELTKAPDETWLDLCRKKVSFYLEMLDKHNRPILWLDVDTRLTRSPDIFSGAKCDIAGFLRGCRYLRDFDSFSASRFFMPFALFFNATPKTRAFLEFMARLERESTVAATDDYFLQEAWQRFPQQLSVLVLPPALVRLPEWPQSEEQVFCFGSSGKVGEFKGQAEQHVPAGLTSARRKAVLLHEAVSASKAKKPRKALLLYKTALEADPSDDALAHKIARLLRRDGKLKQALVFLRRHQGEAAAVNHARRFLADTELDSGNVEKAEAVVRDLIVRGSKDDKAWAQSRLLRIGLEQRAKQQRLTPLERPALWWMETPHPGNFGDILNPYIVEKLSGRPPLFVPRGKGMLAIGSVIKFASERTAVWGSGTPRMTDRLNPNADYRAVRGPLTRQLVKQSGGKAPDVLGDPAWFLPALYQPKTHAKRAKLGVIAHYANADEVMTTDDVILISTIRNGYEGIEEFVDELCSCERILTTSLHGLIVSHAYGIPARWCQIMDSDNPLPGDGTKFHDYMRSVGLEAEEPLLLPKGISITGQDAKEANRLPEREIDLDALAAAAPFPLQPRWRRTGRS